MEGASTRRDHAPGETLRFDQWMAEEECDSYELVSLSPPEWDEGWTLIGMRLSKVKLKDDTGRNYVWRGNAPGIPLEVHSFIHPFSSI